MLQTWSELSFLHWPYPPEIVQRLVPPPLEVETFNGSAWIAVTPFMLRSLRPPFFPPLPWISAFPETNCRTYVRGPDGRSGVWFFSLDADRAPAVAGAQLAFGLPYRWSNMSVERNGRRITYKSARLWPDTHARSSIVIEEGTPIHPRDFENFLTSRWRLFSFILGRLTYTAIEHAPWPLSTGRVVELEQNLIQAAGLPHPEGDPYVLFSSDVTVRVAAPSPVKQP